MLNQKFEIFAHKEILNTLPNLIIEDGGDVVAFGRYLIRSTNGQVDVYNRAGDKIATFGSKKSAISFCVADKCGKWDLAQQITNLDRKKQIISADVDCSRSLVKKSANRAYKNIVADKLTAKIAQLVSVSNQLEKCVNLAKYLQLKGFQNETARVFSN